MTTTSASLAQAASGSAVRTKKRFAILAMLFIVTTINYADRATLSIAGPALSKDLGIDSVTMGYIFSAFGWSYVIAQLPGGWLLDRFGSKLVYAASICLWSVFTLLQGGISFIAANVGLAVVTLFALRFLVGAAEAPSFPANGRIVASWFPAAERGTASAIFNSAQYFATVLFAPLMGWITHSYGWPAVFAVMGLLGIMLSVVWLKTVFTPLTHPGVNQAELDYIAAGGALVNMDQPGTQSRSFPPASPKLGYIKQLLINRMLMGVYVGQYCITTLTYFFLTWFPVYLVKERGMSILSAGFVAALPAICGFAGGVLGGLISDGLLRRGKSLTAARKTPIVVGMLLSTSMILCNYVDSSVVVVAIMSLAFFGKGLGALGWAVVSDTSPKEISGLSGALFNTFGNTAGITTPIVIGYLVKGTGSFNAALVFVAANALVAVCCYLFVVGDIKRFELRKAA
ncbi:ACS family glucarate transporter-like MFS transporter [Pelomonas aquatica]|uniref:ACS family glucarate transporter-like MFS transporter n=1 Tax=Pelomonas aquatica TaxID=431058 RepID=A0ABU1ZB59_9BURK|nr:MFS transporter [Pelomonas aquatica]MDR7297866.1 ACS family glucarate transporter-like MFS transporter [Pelomonas aquatica]